LFRDEFRHRRDRSLSRRTGPLPDPPPFVVVSGTFYRQTAPRRSGLDLLDPAPASGRFHRRGGESRIYASSSKEASWGELFRHSEPGISPFETKRRMSELRVTDLRVLDLTDPELREAFGVSARLLVSNRLGPCQRLAAFVRQWPTFQGILAPSAAIPGMTTLVVFPEGLERVEVMTAAVESPPLQLVHLFERVIGTLPLRVQDRLYDLARAARREYRRRYR
jgi:RES domain-containing protein